MGRRRGGFLLGGSFSDWRLARSVIARWVSVALAGVAVAVVVPAEPAGADPQPGPGCVPVAATTGEAVAVATACGQPVEVLSARTPWETLTAEPTGELTWKAGSRAERTRAGGVWRPVDATVTVGPDGVSPVAPVFPMTFSGGGAEAPLARIEHEDRAVEVFWPYGALPAPSVSGREVTYPSVLPGVDLVVTVQEDGTGFSEVLVVKTPAAADNPVLGRLDFPVREAGGLSVSEAGGGLSVVDSAGTEVFAAPTPLMWDSAGGAGSGQERTALPADGDVVAQMPAQVAGDAIAIVPDQVMLDSAATVWPVHIDPTFDVGEGVSRNEWALLAEAWPAQEYHNFDGSNGVGYCNVGLDSDCVRSGRKRLVWEFNFPAAIRGASVSSAVFAAYKTASADCSREGYHRLYRTNPISTSTNWNNHHAHWDDGGTGDPLDTRPPTRCTGWEEWNATEGAQDAAAARDWTTLTLGLRATDEGDMMKAWRRYRDDATLSITFNRRPNAPGTPLLDMSMAAGTGPSGFYTRDATPRLSASVSDPDGAYGQTVRGVFQILHSGSALVWEGKSALVGSGSVVSPTASPPTLAEGVLYTVRVWGEDAAGSRSAASSPEIQFRVDLSAPATAPVVTAQPVGAGVAATYVENGWAGGPGQTGRFSFGPNGTGDAVRYRYSFDSTTYTGEVAAGTGGVSASPVSYTPSGPGLHTLRVWTVDRAGWVGPVRTYPMWVYAAPKAAWWLLDGGGADSAAGAGNPLTVSGTASWVTGPSAAAYPGDKALRLDGATGGAATAGPVVHTSGSFTVTALVNTNDLSTSRVAVSQDGLNTSGFKLGLLNESSLCPAEVGSPCWAFWTANQDAAGSSHTRAVAGVDPNEPQRFAVQTGRWTAVAGVYDASAHQIRLYVDGYLAGTAPFTANWDAVRKMRIGQAMNGGAAQQFWSGDLDDVRVYRAALDADTIRRVAQGSRDANDIPQ